MNDVMIPLCIITVGFNIVVYNLSVYQEREFEIDIISMESKYGKNIIVFYKKSLLSFDSEYKNWRI